MSKLTAIQQEIQVVLSQVNENLLIDTAALIRERRRIFVVGEGRSGLMAKSFAMRLMHLGATVYVVGETITPALSSEDILVAISGSGKTKSVIWTAETAHKLGCTVLVLTTNPSSPLVEEATHTICIPASTKYRQANEMKSIQPLGSLFDQCAHIIFDTICLNFAELNEIGFEEAFKRHSNME
ncbi:6-phospho-3-hexuloisomerase [Niallia circulans]|uniref:6-phospho-3-hexuloisomerase n=1 Tax=Niallia circulans TaxID=1397 RepID=UPI003978A8BC